MPDDRKILILHESLRASIIKDAWTALCLIGTAVATVELDLVAFQVVIATAIVLFALAMVGLRAKRRSGEVVELSLEDAPVEVRRWLEGRTGNAAL